MFKVYKKEIDVAGKKISLETGKVARQADGAIIATCGETVVLATVVGAKKVNPDMDYFPLSVNYQEKYYAAGKIPGGYFKREARPTESETLISRLIDRPIRPLFPDEFKNEVQLLPTVISYDKENEPDILSITASSAALAISGMPFMGPVGASRVGFVDGKYVLNPSKAELEKSKLDLVVAGTKDAVLMVESEANGLTEEEMLNAVKFGHEGFVRSGNCLDHPAYPTAFASFCSLFARLPQPIHAPRANGDMVGSARQRTARPQTSCRASFRFVFAHATAWLDHRG